MSDKKQVNLSSVSRMVFGPDRKGWRGMSDDDKASMFFIFNRYCAKKYPAQARKFNTKSADKTTAMDLWEVAFRNSHKVPEWFWAGSRCAKKQSKNPLTHLHDLHPEELDLLIELYPEEALEWVKASKKTTTNSNNE